MRRGQKGSSKKFFLIGLFILLVAGVSIGYAALQTTLSINGTTTINKVGWDIHFENIVVAEGAAENGSAIINANDNTEVTYNVTLGEPGDFYEFSVDIKNAGTLPAKLESIVNPGLTEEEELYANYTVTGMPAVNSVLAAGESKTVTIRVEFDPDIEPEDLPTENKILTKTIKFNYVQNK